jgi:hypothetical protein
MKPSFGLALTLLAVAIPAAAPAQPAKSIGSPDGRLRAEIAAVGKAGYKATESRVVIRESSGRVIFKKNFASADGEHGFGVARAAWTADTRFFVFSLQSSGGHQPWHWPTYVYDRGKSRLYLLDDLIGPITTGEFSLRAPDVLETRKMSPVGSDRREKVTLRLSRLKTGRRLSAHGD